MYEKHRMVWIGHVCKCVCASVCMCKSVCMYVYAYIHMHAGTQADMQVCQFVRASPSVCVYTRIHTNIEYKCIHGLDAHFSFAYMCLNLLIYVSV
jgi:hypothetical protein